VSLRRTFDALLSRQRGDAGGSSSSSGGSGSSDEDVAAPPSEVRVRVRVLG